MTISFTIPDWALWIPIVYVILAVLAWPLMAYWCSIWISGNRSFWTYLSASSFRWPKRLLCWTGWLLWWPFGLWEILPRRYRSLKRFRKF